MNPVIEHWYQNRTHPCEGCPSLQTLSGNKKDIAVIPFPSPNEKQRWLESDIPGRIGGDEFVVLAIEPADSDIALFRIRLQNAVDSFNSRGARRFLISLSAGVARYAPDSHYLLRDLIAHADFLMYKEKRTKKGQDV